MNLNTFRATALPASVSVERFANARALELRSMERSLRTARASEGKRIFQVLPRSLRRRAASHSIRRVPQRFRGKAKFELQGVPGPREQKRTVLRRKYRRRLRKTVSSPRNGPRRLNTHLWHAKRMHMINIYGHRLADTPTQRSHRASYRAMIGGALVHDASYMQYIEISGDMHSLNVLLSQVCDPSDVSPMSLRFINGSRECSTYLYKPGRYPYDLIGPCSILLRPTSPHPTSLEVRTLWIRFHPSVQVEATAALKKAGATPVDGFVAPSITPIELGTLEVVGPSGTSILITALSETCGQMGGHDVLGMLSSHRPQDVPVGTVIGLEISASPPAAPVNCPSDGTPVRPDSDLAACSIWDPARRYGKQGTPVLLIRHSRGSATPSPANTLEMAGWKLVCSSNWTKHLFYALVRKQPKVGGQRECSQMDFEAGVPHFPKDFPTTTSFDETESRRREILSSHWHKKPPAKRENFVKLKSPHPFATCFSSCLLWSDNPDSPQKPWLLSGSLAASFMQRLPSLLCMQANNVAAGVACLTQLVSTSRDRRHLPPLPFTPQHAKYALVRVRIVPCFRGSPAPLAFLYSVSEEHSQTIKHSLSVTQKQPQCRDNASLVFDPPREEEIIGRITSGSYSLRLGHGFGIGTVALTSFLASYKANSTSFLLVKNHDHNVCHAATMHLLP